MDLLQVYFNQGFRRKNPVITMMGGSLPIFVLQANGTYMYICIRDVHITWIMNAKKIQLLNLINVCKTTCRVPL